MNTIDKIVRTVKLSGDDSIEFYNSLFKPTREELLEAQRRVNEIRSSVEVTLTDDGLIANVKDLDLSFLCEPIEKKLDAYYTDLIEQMSMDFWGKNDQDFYNMSYRADAITALCTIENKAIINNYDSSFGFDFDLLIA